MEDTLNWSHLAPTTPDTLGAYPFSGEDPFVLDECPHIYFAANQATYDSKLITGTCPALPSRKEAEEEAAAAAAAETQTCCAGPKGQVVRLISVPSFTKTSTIVLVNLKTLATHPITFNADLDL
jgi:DNA polymerase delta subunit 2